MFGRIFLVGWLDSFSFVGVKIWQILWLSTSKIWKYTIVGHSCQNSGQEVKKNPVRLSREGVIYYVIKINSRVIQCTFDIEPEIHQPYQKQVAKNIKSKSVEV